VGNGGRLVASPPKAFDVWFVAANTVYKQVPYQVVADWTQQGRLAAADMLRPAGSKDSWKRVDEFELMADYLPRPALAAVPVPATAGDTPGGATAPAAVPEPPEDDYHPHRQAESEDDDVDMIPLIDISMVLLVFFIMLRAAGALSPVDVPDMTYAGEMKADPEAVTISVEKATATDVVYSVRVGENAPRKDHADLPNPEAALAVLDEILAERPRPPEVRIACARDLPSERVFELIRELKSRKDKNYINSFCAEVNEAPKQQ
jgi:biopolymer transport protein ExbD